MRKTLRILLVCCAVMGGSDPLAEAQSTSSYTNYFQRNATNGPVVLHVVKLDRRQVDWQFGVALAKESDYGLATLRELVGESRPHKPLAAINGDFYQRRGYQPGDPRGLMINHGELLSAPSGGAVFWVDAQRRLHLDKVRSQLTIAWPSGRTESLGLNEELRSDRPSLYTVASGDTTPSVRGRLGREMILDSLDGKPLLPLRPGTVFRARIKAVLDTGGTPLTTNTLVLAVSTNWLAKAFLPLPGMVLKISLRTDPNLQGAMTAIGGGPIIIRGSTRLIQTTKAPRKNLPNSVKHVWDQHPRSAIGWNRDYFYLVAVDGRQPGHSDGMNMADLAIFMRKQLECTDAVNLDGGGSTTLWYDGEVLNSPADGYERPVANALFIFDPARPILSESPAAAE